MRQSVENHGDEEIHNSQQLKRKVIKEEIEVNSIKRVKHNSVEKNETKIKEQEPLKKKKQCYFCDKKLKLLTDFSCRCGNIFCAKHRFHDQHNCTFNYRKKALKKLKEMNPKIVHDKIKRQ